jgi:hypothetical protein
VSTNKGTQFLNDNNLQLFTWPGANIINYGVFAIIYGTQLPCEEFTGKFTVKHNLYVLKKSVNLDNIGP